MPSRNNAINDDLLVSKQRIVTMLQLEVRALDNIVEEISHTIIKRDQLQGNSLKAVAQQQDRISGALLNLQAHPADNRRLALEERLADCAKQQQEIQGQAFTNIIELKKQLWHYWFLCSKKRLQLYMIK